MTNTNNERFAFLDEHVDFDYVIETFVWKDYSQFVVSEGGDVLTYRVYGNDIDDMKIYEK